MFPPMFGKGYTSERNVFEAFSKLSDEWTVLHSVMFKDPRDRNQKRGARGTADREIDFLLLHAKTGGFVIEVKGGVEISVRDGQWFSTPHGSDSPKLIDDPFVQAKKNSYAFGHLLTTVLPSEAQVPHITYAVAFPSHSQIGDMGLERPRQLILDQDDLLNPEASLQRIATFVNRFQDCTRDDIDNLRRVIRPDFTIPISGREKLETARITQEKLTEEQDGLVSYIGTNFKRCIVNGPAGTGKTVLALNDARRLSALGHRTLFLCFNRLLADKLRNETFNFRNLHVNTFDGNALRLADIENIPLEGPEDHAMAVMMAAERQSNKVDAIIIDEAQDFQSDWWEAVLALLDDPNSSYLHIFADPTQDIYEGSGLDQFNYARFPLTKNCRNTAEIAKFVHRIGRVTAETLLGASGPQPEFIRVKNREELVQESSQVINRWYANYDLNAEHVTVLTDRADLRAFLIEALAESTCNNGRAIEIETIHRFKGLESIAVLCAFDPESDSQLDDSRLQRLGYVGLSRARTLLAVLGTSNTLSRLRP